MRKNFAWASIIFIGAFAIGLLTVPPPMVETANACPGSCFCISEEEPIDCQHYSSCPGGACGGGGCTVCFWGRCLGEPQCLCNKQVTCD